MAKIFLGYEGMVADQQLHYMMTTEDGGAAALPPGEEEEEEENEIENMMATEEREKEELLPYLDEGIITEILVKVHSTESLYNSLRYVCKPWNNIISHNPDIHLNFLLPSSKPTATCSSTSCIIIQNTDNSSARYVSRTPEEVLVSVVNDRSFTTCLLKMGITREGDVFGLEQQVDFTPIFKKLRIRNCCNGLVLATPEGPLNREALCIVNPLTNHIVVLPSPIKRVFSLSSPVGFTFLPSTGKYKVVTMGYDHRDEHNFFQVLTMSSPPPAAAVGHCSSDSDGADPCPRWRPIETPEPLYGNPLEINGIYYWPQSHEGVGYITSFDVTSETFYTTPHDFFRYTEENRLYNGFIDFGGYLAFWSFRPADGAGEEGEEEEEGEEVETERTFSVHVMEDLHKIGGEWKELCSGIRMDLDFIKAGWVIPCLSVGNGEVMIFRNASDLTLWAYHFKSQRWLKVGNDLKELDFLNFWGYIVRSSSTPMPFDSLFCLKQTTK